MRGSSISVLLILSLICIAAAKRVAVIGAGIAGGSTAYFTHKYGSDVEIHVYEKSDRIGGRMKHVEFGGEVCEVGADAWSSVNEYLMGLMKELNVPMDDSDFDGNGEMGFYEGNQQWYHPNKDTMSEALLYAQVEMFKYRLHSNYEERDKIGQGNTIPTPFKSVEEFVSFGKMVEYTDISIANFGKKHNIAEDLLWGKVLPVIRAIYDQNLTVSAFGAIVSLLPAMTDAYSVAPGNSVLVEMLLNQSGASVHLDTHINVIANVNGSYQLSSDQGQLPLIFDSVVIANPIEFSDIVFKDMSIPPITPRKFQHWFVTLILCESLNPSYFGNISKLPDNVFTTGNSTAPFVVVAPIAKSKSTGLVVFKIFSEQDVSSEIRNIFIGVKETFVQVWPFTFPDLSPQKSYQPFVLAPNLYYTSGIESVATAMECSTIAGRNAALWIANMGK